jgi:hypothetical protein
MMRDGKRGWAIGIGLAATVAGVALLPEAGRAQLQQPASLSMQRGDGGWSPALFVCDGTNRDHVLVMSAPDKQRHATLTSYNKPGLGTHSVSVTLGAGDAGMSQVWYPLLADDGREVGNVHTISPGVVEPGATTPTVTSLRYGQGTTNCRFAPQTRVLGATAKRSVQVTRTERSGYRYRSYNYDSNLAEIEQPWGGRDTRASTTIDGGRLVDQSGGRRIYEFTRAGYVYRVLASVDPAHGGGGVQVWRDGRMLLGEPFGAYTAAIQP